MKRISGLCNFSKNIQKSKSPITNILGYEIQFEGEIYNYDEISRDLKTRGYALDNDPAEFILYCYIEYGMEFPAHLNGAFAISIWNQSTGTLYLCRDAMGIKPLFYYPNSKFTAYGCEPKNIFSFPEINPEINIESLQQILGIGPARIPGQGLFKGLKEILPGHYLIANKYGICDRCYWDIPIKDINDSYTDIVDHVRYLVKDSISRQMGDGRNLCSFLSGGLDSSIVTAVAQDILSREGRSLKTYSFDFKENKKYFQSNSFQPELDRPYIDIMADYLHTDHKYLECDEETLFRTLYDAVDARDYPGMTDVDASLIYFCSRLDPDSANVLTGECADEVFGGYPWFYQDKLMNVKGFPWSHDISVRTMLINDKWKKKLDLEDYSYDVYLSALKDVPIRDGLKSDDLRRHQVSYLCIKWFMETLLERMDRAGSRNNINAKVPFADKGLVEYVFNLPWNVKYRNNQEKHLLREATSHLLPDKISARKKSPYPKTYHPGYEALLRNKFTEILCDSDSPILPMLDIGKTYDFIQAPKSYGRPWFGQLMAGPQMMAYYIQLDYWMRKYNFSL